MTDTADTANAVSVAHMAFTADAVREEMTHRGWSQSETARRSGVTQATISRVLSGARQADDETLAKLAEVFDVQVSDLRGLQLSGIQGEPGSPAAETPAEPPAENAAETVDDAENSARGTDLIALRLIAPSPLNPRKIFNPAGLAELADSIAAHGLLQPLEVRAVPAGTIRPLSDVPHAALPCYQIVFGERRFRALALLAREGRLPLALAGGIPCRLVDIDDRAHVERALIENLQRSDVTAGEEADAFAFLRDLGASTAEIATAIGKSGKSGQRYVQQRLQLVARLAPEVRAALDDPEHPLDFARARVLATTDDAARQVELLAEVVRWPFHTSATALRTKLRSGAWLAERARFDRARYTGEVYTDEDGAEWLRDIAQAKTLQRAWVAERKAALEATGTYASVEIVSRLDPDDYEPCDDPARALALLEYFEWSGEYAEHLGVVEKAGEAVEEDPEALAARARRGAELAAESEAARLRHDALDALTRDMRAAFAADPLLALRLGLLGVLLSGRDDRVDELLGNTFGEAAEAAIAALGASFSAALLFGENEEDDDALLPPTTVSAADVWRWLNDLDAPGLATLASAAAADGLNLQVSWQDGRLHAADARLCRLAGVAIPEPIAPAQTDLEDAIGGAEAFEDEDFGDGDFEDGDFGETDDDILDDDEFQDEAQ